MMAIFWALGIRIRVCVTSTAEASWIRSVSAVKRSAAAWTPTRASKGRSGMQLVGGGEIGADVGDEEGLGGVGKLAG